MSRYRPLTPFGLLREVYLWADERADGSRFPTWVWLLVPLAMFAALVSVKWFIYPATAWATFALFVLLAVAAGCLLVGVVSSLRDL